MSHIDYRIEQLQDLFQDLLEAEEKRDLRMRGKNAAELDERRELYDRPVENLKATIKKTIEAKILRYGIHFDRHGDAIQKFHELAPYEKSAFVMTKYPNVGDAGADAGNLQQIIDLVADALRLEGFEPRVARDRQYHDQLWDNVELHALGSSLGVAISESRYMPEFNPNVAMEWGWMRGMGRPVIILVEKDFKLRADVEGIIRAPFDWNDPIKTIPVALKNAINAVKTAGRL